MSAETGVGPAMASGSHTYSGSWADLPQAPKKRKKAMAVAMVTVMPLVCWRKPVPSLAKYVIEPTAENVRNVAIMKPKSPTRFVTNAFLPATAFGIFSNQNEMRKYEQAPTPSHPRKVTRR